MKRLRYLAAILVALATFLTTALGLAFEPPPIATLPERLGLGRRP